MSPKYLSRKTLEGLSARESLTKNSSLCMYCTVTISPLAMLACTIILGSFLVSAQDESIKIMSRCSKIGSILRFFAETKRDTSMAIRCQVSPAFCTNANKTALIASHTQIYQTIVSMNPFLATEIRAICFLPIENLIASNVSSSLSARLLTLSAISFRCSVFLETAMSAASKRYSYEADQHIESSRQTLLISISAFCGIVFWVISILMWTVHKSVSDADINIKKHQEHMRRMLRSWNHDNKNVAGALLSGLEELEQSVEDLKDPDLLLSLHQCQSLSSHVAHSVSVMSVRHAISSGTSDLVSIHRQPVNLLSIVSDILRIPGFEDFTLLSPPDGQCMAYTVPAVCYHVFYQILRNAYVHGSSPRIVEVCNGVFRCKNGPSPHHAELLRLPTDLERLAHCLSGNTGSKTSSGIGLRDTFDLCLLEEIQVAFSFLADGVEMVCDFRSHDHSGENTAVKVDIAPELLVSENVLSLTINLQPCTR